MAPLENQTTLTARGWPSLLLVAGVITLVILLAAACGGKTGGDPDGPDGPPGGTASDTPGGNEAAFTVYASPT